MSDYAKITNFKEVIDLAQKGIEEPYKINFSLKVEFSVDDIREAHLLDVKDLAQDFQNTNKPAKMYINHGSYITEAGIPYVIEELKNKNNGNRALISLIKQEDIIGTGDKPIPSFMILQFSIEEGVQLYVTTYFRALEVSKFLKINLEEIRLIINQVVSQIRGIKNIRLNIFAFRAYINEQINPLIKPEIEMLSGSDILISMQEEPRKLINMLKEKIAYNTVIENGSMEIINELANDPKKNIRISLCFKTPQSIKLLKQCISTGKRLEELRKNTSHNNEINILNIEFKQNIEKYIEELEANCQ